MEEEYIYGPMAWNMKENKNNKIEGKGVWSWPNGDKYIRNFKNGKYNGYGVLVYNDGKRYEGDF